MIWINKLFTNSLIKCNKFNYYIHLKDHNKKITPEKNKLTLSFMNPKHVDKSAPQSTPYVCSLRKKTQKQLQRKMFEQYKQKVLKGQIDQDEQIIIDPLWGEGQKPKHYFQNISKVQLMTVSHSQSSQFSNYLASVFSNYFSVQQKQTPSSSELSSLKISQLVNVALNAAKNQNTSQQFWFNFQKSFGNKFYQLSFDDLIKLNFALRQHTKKCSPRIHKIVHDLILQDLSNFTHQQLCSLFYSLKDSKNQGISLQQQILKSLQPLYEKMTFEEKVNWLLTYAICRKPQTLKKAQKKVLNEGAINGHKILFNLNFSNDLSKQLTSVSQCSNIVFSLAKLRSKNTKFLVDQIISYLKSNNEALSSDLESSYKLLFYLQEVQGGQGIFDQQLFDSLVTTLTQPNNFASLTKIQQIKTIYAIWNYGLLTDQLFQLYKNIQMEAQSTLLYYFTQIQFSRSSQRQWQVLRCLAELEYIPMPYFQVFKRFYNYIKVTVPEWDLTPIEQKLKNTEYYFDVLRGKDAFYNISVYRNLMKHYKFSEILSPFEHTLPIQNLEIGQFGNVKYQVSVDVVNQKAFVPGTNELKQSYRNKIRSLSYIGWKHVTLRQKQLSKLQAHQQIQEIIYAFIPYIQQQREVIANAQYYRAQQIEAMRNQEYWNSMVAQQAQGYRNNPQEYAKKVAQMAQKQRKLSEQIAKVQ